MPRPIVEVLQKVANIQTTVTDPTQATLIVGPNYNIIDYDSTDTQAVRDLAKVDDFEPYADGSTAANINVVVDLSPRGAVHSDSVNIYLEDAEYEVGTESDKDVTSSYGAADTTWANLQSDHADWAYTIERSAGFNDAAVVGGIKAGDKVVIDYKMANVFVPDTEFTSAQLDLLGDETKVVTITDAGAVVTNQLVYHNYTLLNQLGGFSSDHIDLFEETPDTNPTFSKLDGVDLELTNNTVATLKICAADDLTVALETITGKLTIPADQVTHVKEVNNNVTVITVKDHLRQFVSSHLTAASQKISCRVQRPVSSDYSVSSIKLTDEDWDFSVTTVGDVTFSTAVTLQDTNLPNAAALPDKAITYGKMYISSKSLVTTSAHSAISISSLNLTSELGKANSKNPLGLAASIALQNAGTTSVSVMRTAVDSNQGLLDALPFISANPNVYAILPLTQDLSVLSTYGTAAAAQSAPEVGKFRIVLGSAETAPLWRYWAGTRANEYGWAASNLASGTVTNAVKNAGVDETAVIQDPEGGFLAAGGPAVGDVVYFAYSTVDGNGDTVIETDTFKCTVASIESNSSMTVNLPNADLVVVNNNSTISFTGASDIKDNRAAQVEDLVKAISPLTANLEVAKRLVMVYPGEVSIGNEAGLPGYYLTAALGGMLAAFEPHRPKNQIAVAGIADIEYSNLGYFTEAQIDDLGDAGYFVFVQEIPGGLPYCVHQVTLGYKDYASTQEYSELSVVNNFDYVSSVFKNTLTPYVGVWNVIPQAYSSIMASLDSAILSLRSRSTDRIGSPLVSGNIVSVEPSEADAGTINVVMDVQLPKVLNKIRLEVVSQ